MIINTSQLDELIDVIAERVSPEMAQVLGEKGSGNCTVRGDMDNTLVSLVFIGHFCWLS